jgi:excisionase family DNA binding protein
MGTNPGAAGRAQDRVTPAATMHLKELAETLDISVNHAYELAQADELPVPVIRVGRQLRFSRRLVEELLNRTHEAAS